MNNRIVAFFGASALAAAAVWLPTGVSAQSSAAKPAAPAAAKPAAPAQTNRTASAGKYSPPRLADGHPDLQGVFNVATITPLERPQNVTGLTISDEEAAKAEKYLAGVVTPEDRIHADPLARNALEFFWRYPTRMNVSVYGEPGRQDMVECGDYVLRNRSYDSWLTSRPGMWLTMRGFETPTAVQNPPENWRVQWTNQNATLFKVACGG